MNSSRSRKIIYMLSIVGLFVCMIALKRPLEDQATKYRLTEKSLGNVDPVSGTAQLVFTGFRGVAVTFLWHEAIELKREQRWFEIRPVLESITLLQPHFVEPWTFQAWNMAYNIAAEWESVADKYYWIQEGIQFMKNATRLNQKISDLEWYVGWLYYNRFGMSDEKMYLREMYRRETDTAFASSNLGGTNDNFKTSYDWFVVANQTVRDTGEKPRKRGITPFMSYPAVSRSSYAEFLAEDGEGTGAIFGEVAMDAWRQARDEWLKFGREGEPGRYAFIHKLEYTPEEYAQLTEEERYWAEHYAKIVNYYYWKKRTASEATPEMQAAREAFYNAEQAFKKGNYQTAIAEYEKAFPIWRKILENDDNLRSDILFQEDSQEHEARYLKMLSWLSAEQPEKRPFEGLFPALEEDTMPRTRDLERSSAAGLDATSPPEAEAKSTPDAPAKAEEKKAEQSKAEEPKAEQPKADEKKAQEPKAEQPKAETETPKTEPQAKPVEPEKPAEPKPAEPKAAEPKPEEPKAESEAKGPESKPDSETKPSEPETKDQ